MPSTYPLLLARPALSEHHVLAPDGRGRACWAFQTSAGPVLPIVALAPPVVRGMTPSYRLDFAAPLPRPAWQPTVRLVNALLLAAACCASASVVLAVAYCFCF